MIHKLSMRVYYHDTDARGVVYHASYLNFGERARNEFLRDLGYGINQLQEEESTLFVVKNLSIDYIKPAKLDDLVEVQTIITELKNSSFVMEHQIYRLNDNKEQGDLLTEMKVTLVCVDTNTIKPKRMPEAIRQKFEPYLVR